MNTHISDELPMLLSGEADRESVLAAAAHLRGCVDCQQELVSAVVAHASLTSARRFAPEIMPRTGVLTAHSEQGAPMEQTPTRQPALLDSPDLPDLSGMFAQIREELDSVPSATPAPVPSPASSRQGSWAGRGRLLVAAAAAGLLVGGGGVALGAHYSSNTSGGRTVALQAFQQGTVSASVKLDSGQLSMNAAALPKLDSAQRYEVWLTDAGRTRMQPIGWIDTDGKATLTVPANLLSTFSAIEVSVQTVDSSGSPNYAYSGVSVLRGSYTT